MPHPHEIKLTDPKGVIHWQSLGYDRREIPSDLTEFWDAVKSLSDNIGGKDHKKIIHKLYRKDGTPKFKDYDDLVKVLGKTGNKKDERAFQEWHTTMKVIRVQVAQRIRINRLKKERDERKNRIKRDKEKRRAEREERKNSAKLIAAEAIRFATTKSNV